MALNLAIFNLPKRLRTHQFRFLSRPLRHAPGGCLRRSATQWRSTDRRQHAILSATMYTKRDSGARAHDAPLFTCSGRVLAQQSKQCK